MAGEKNFNIKNGLSVGGVEVINSSGDLVAGGVGTAVNEAIADKIGSILSATGGATATYDDSADTIVINVPITDEDDMSSNSATAIPSQQSVKAYVDSQILTKDNTDEITEGSTNLYHTTERVQDVVGAFVSGSGSTSVTYDDAAGTLTISSTGKTEEEIQDIVGAQLVTNGSHTNITASYDDSGDGAVDLSITDAAIRGKVSVTDAGGDGSLAYDNGSGVITYTGPSASEVRAHITAGTGVGISSGQVSIGQAVGTSDKPSFAGVTLTADSDVTGHIIPTADDTYDLGSSSKQWRDVYVGPGSLYVNGQKVLEDSSGTITVSADDNQNVSVQTGGSGDVELDPTGSGSIQLKGPISVQAGNNIGSSDGNAISFSNSIDVDAIESRSTNTNLTLSANGTGVVAVSDSMTISGDLTVSGTTTTVNSETINLADNIIALNSNFTSGSPTEDTGISVTRGGSASKTLIWDESEDKWSVGSETFVAGTFEGALTGNVTGNVSGSSGSTTGNAATATALATGRTINGVTFDGTANITTLTAGTGVAVSGTAVSIGQAVSTSSNVEFTQITTNYANNSGGVARNVYQSTSAPTGSDGAVGDLWILYS
tara:strand:- start:10847 stop:12649 length:1803 start_codon:yes stop_codon:yes gene_type:complete